MPYLTEAEVAATVAAVAACSAPNSRLIVNFQMPAPSDEAGPPRGAGADGVHRPVERLGDRAVALDLDTRRDGRPARPARLRRHPGR